MTTKENSNNGKIILAGAFVAAATGVAIYMVRRAFDFQIPNPTKGEYYKGDPIDKPQVKDGGAEYMGHHEDVGLLREIAPQV